MNRLVLYVNVFELVDNNYFQKENVAIGSKVDKTFGCKYIRSESSNLKERQATIISGPLKKDCHLF